MDGSPKVYLVKLDKLGPMQQLSPSAAASIRLHGNVKVMQLVHITKKHGKHNGWSALNPASPPACYRAFVYEQFTFKPQLKQ